uniref:Uncharacterized protein n=1 Tax=Anguilla anguilla TaxID=7936 RepID=A0A0E9SBJ9_ANGAN
MNLSQLSMSPYPHIELSQRLVSPYPTYGVFTVISESILDSAGLRNQFRRCS